MLRTHAVTLQALDPDRDEARDWLVAELSQPDYNRAEPFLTRVYDWFVGLLTDLLQVVPASQSLGWLVVLGVLAAAAVAVTFGVLGRRRGSTLRAARSGGVLEEAHLTPEDYRARAAEAAGRQDWDTVLLDSFRALTADAARRALLDDVPALTAHEVGALLAAPFPNHAASLDRVAREFDAVRYGGRRADRGSAEAARDLDHSLSMARPALEQVR